MTNFLLSCILVFIPLFSIGQTIAVDSLLNLLESKPEIEHTELYNQLYDIYHAEENIHEAISSSHKALAMAQKYNSMKDQYYSLVNIATGHDEIGNHDSSIFFNKKAIKVAKEMDNKMFIARANNNLGNAYSHISAIEKTLSCYFVSLKIIEDTLPNISWAKNLKYKSIILNNIGLVYSKLGNTTHELEYLEKSLKIREQQNNRPGMATCYQNLGTVYEKQKDYDHALELYEKALEIREDLGNEGHIAEVIMNIGILNSNMLKYDVAEQKLKASIDIFKRQGDMHFLSYAYQSLANLYLKMNKPDDAYPNIISGIELTKETGNMSHQASLLSKLSEYYTKKNNHKKALETQKKQIVLKDSIFNSELTDKIANLQTLYEIDKMEKENEFLKSEAVSRKKTQIILFVVIASLLILSVLLFFMFRYKQKSLHNSKSLYKEQKKFNKLAIKSKESEKLHLEELVYAEKKINSLQQDKIQNKNRELSTNTLHSINNNKILSEIKKDITQISKEEYPDNTSLKKIIDLIDGNIVLDQDWDQFKKHFEEVHKGFFQNLTAKHPTLTNNELKLCAYLKIGMSTKEIARIMIVTIAAIKKNRQRLRKKLNIETEEDLMDFFNKV